VVIYGLVSWYNVIEHTVDHCECTMRRIDGENERNKSLIVLLFPSQLNYNPLLCGGSCFHKRGSGHRVMAR